VASRATCFHTGFLLGLLFGPEGGGDMILQNFGLFSTDHGIISQKIDLFTKNAVENFVYCVMEYAISILIILCEKVYTSALL
jgi:hypothetical protein